MARRRLRKRLLQVRLTEDERDRLAAIARQEGSTQADVVRAWIGQHQLHGPLHLDPHAPPDPRQLRLYD